MQVTDWLVAAATVVNAGIVLWLALTTKRYADLTDGILKANRDSLNIMQTSAYGAVYTWAADLLSKKELIDHRRRVITELPCYKGDLQSMPKELRESFKEVCRTYDAVGIAGHNGMLPHRIIAKEWGYSIIKTHEACEKFLGELRSQRGPMFWNNFTELYKEAKEVWTEPQKGSG